MLLHVALLWHDKTDKEHSSMSTIALKNICHVKITYEKLVKKTSQDSMNNFVPVQFTPFHENPLLHVHWKDPPMLLHIALLWHGETTKEHSSISIVEIKHQNDGWEVGQENKILKDTLSCTINWIA